MRGRIAGTRRCGRRRAGSSPRRIRAARPASVRSSSTRSRGDWGGKVMIDLDAVFDAVAKMPFVDATRMGIAGASYGGYAVNWILGSDRSLQGGRDPRRRLQPRFDEHERPRSCGSPNGSSAAVAWDAKARAQFAKWSPHLHRAARSRRRRSSSPTSWISACPSIRACSCSLCCGRNGVPAEMIVFPGRGALGAEGAQQPLLARDGVRVDR